MLPIKITALNEDANQNDIAVVGVGEKGSEAIYKLSYPVYGYHNYSCIRKLILCDDSSLKNPSNDQDLMRSEIQNARWLFALVDTSDCESLQNACEIADWFKKGEHKFKHSVCVCCCEQDEKSLLILHNKYDTLVHCSNETLLNQVPILCADICRLFRSGRIDVIDFVDLFSFFNETSVGFYHQFNLSDIAVIGEKTEALKAKMKVDGFIINDKANALVNINVTPVTSLETIDEILKNIGTVITGDIIWNFHTDNDEDDKNLHVSMIYGKDNNSSKTELFQKAAELCRNTPKEPYEDRIKR